MSSFRELYERFRHLIHEGAKFLVIGAIGTVVTFGAANLLAGVGRYKAITIATVLATVVTYLGNRHWTFRDRQGQGTTRDTLVFLVLNGVGLLIYYGCIGLTDLAGLCKSKLWYNAALVVGTGLGTLFRFWSYRKWVWVEADSPVLARSEPDEERAHDLAAIVGAAPLAHHQDPVHFAPGDHAAAPGPNGANGTHGSNGAHAAGGSHAAAGGEPATVGSRPRGSRAAPGAHRRTP